MFDDFIYAFGWFLMGATAMFLMMGLRPMFKKGTAIGVVFVAMFSLPAVIAVCLILLAKSIA